MAFAVSCTQCGTRFALGAELYERKFKGRIVTVRCKHCKADITVDGTGPISHPGSALEANEQPTEALWVVSYGDDDDRDLTLEQLEAELENRHIKGSTLVWREGMPEWLPLEKIPELVPLLKKARAKPPPRKGVPKPPRRDKEVGPFRSDGAGTLFLGGVDAPPKPDAPPIESAPTPSSETPSDSTTEGENADPVAASELTPPEPEPLREPQASEPVPARPSAVRRFGPWMVLIAAAAVAIWWLVLRPAPPHERAPTAAAPIDSTATAFAPIATNPRRIEPAPRPEPSATPSAKLKGPRASKTIAPSASNGARKKAPGESLPLKRSLDAPGGGAAPTGSE